MVNIIEIANFCRQEIEDKCKASDRRWGYGILYATVNENEELVTSKTPHILSSGRTCIIIHSWDQLAETIAYDTYHVHVIRENGEVSDGKLDSNFSIKIEAARFNTPARINLYHNCTKVYSDYISPWQKGHDCEDLMRFIYTLYAKCKSQCETTLECKMLCKLAEQEKTVEALNERLSEYSFKETLLQKELDSYKNLLDQVKSLIEK